MNEKQHAQREDQSQPETSEGGILDFITDQQQYTTQHF